MLMKERLIWEQFDPHAKALAPLKSKLGAQIAKNLGIKAESDALCLSCHSSFVPPERRGAEFSPADGIQCESCHGAGGDFLRTHMQTTSTHSGNVRAGMFPTEDPAARATLCLSCHRGDDRRELVHQVYAAGHPRLRFELDTFSVNQPYHYVQDADYRIRKPSAGHAKLWVEGQIATAQAVLKRVARFSHETTPDFSGLDCTMCHHGAGGEEQRGPRPGLTPGQPYIDDVSLVLLRPIAKLVAPSMREELLQQTRALQTSLDDAGKREEALRTLQKTVASLASHAAGAALSDKDDAALLANIAGEYFAEQPLTFIGAENFAMSLSTLLEAARESKSISDARYTAAKRAVDRIYSALKNENNYQPAALQSSFEELRDVFGSR